MKSNEFDYIKGTIWGFLSKNIPRKKKDLAFLAGTDERTVKLAIHSLRYDDGKIICSGNAGYWLPKDRADPAIIKTRKRLESQRDKMSQMIALMKRYEIEGQLAFDDLEEVSA